jgi:hypothetical protein
VALNDRIIMCINWKGYVETVVAYLKVLSENLSGETEESQETPQQ